MTSMSRTGGCSRRAGVTLVELTASIAVIVALVGLTFVLFTVGERAAQRLESQVARFNPPHSRKARPHLPPTGNHKIPNQYIVTFNKSVTNPQAEANRLGKSIPANILQVYTSVIKGCALRIQPGDLATLQADPAVAAIEQDQMVYKSIIPTGVSRIEFIHAPRPPPVRLFIPTIQTIGGGTNNNGPRNLPANILNNIGNTIPIKPVVIMDTGIDSSHPELNVVFSAGFGANNPNGLDQDGHGTHVSGIVGARWLTVSVVALSPWM